MFSQLFAFVLAALAQLVPAAAPAPPVVVDEPAPIIVEHSTAYPPAGSVGCPDGTVAIPDAAGVLGCPGPAALPDPVGRPPAPPVVEPAPDPCFREDPECYND